MNQELEEWAAERAEAEYFAHVELPTITHAVPLSDKPIDFSKVPF